MTLAKEDRAEQVMVYAQLDLAGAIKFALGLNDTFNVKAAQRTLEELHEITGDPAGKDLMHRKLELS